MRVALICTDKAGALQTRLDNRSAHLAYIAETGVVEMAGPFLSPEGQMTGSLVVLEVGSLAEAEAWAADDPYAQAGLFESVAISEWKKVVG
ncbi:YciI family protein [Cereibacter sphaeroides]|uniref:YciI family protein n=1 Tax=Cereibacter sphaeroides TaxID=1063 RepID=UPI000F52EDAD|nr:YciI family protein [Cereibacter sphaeroides]AZB65100.1 YciI family protein [Cereibacter sphaeroides]AZB66958.1 YciI family protein [Cereibacter sphaeroides]